LRINTNTNENSKHGVPCPPAGRHPTLIKKLFTDENIEININLTCIYLQFGEIFITLALNRHFKFTANPACHVAGKLNFTP